MGKFFENVNLFNYSWDQMARAFWRRYPNPHSTHVLSEDTLHREVRNGELYSRRLLIKTNRLPKWGEIWVKSSITAIVEESYVNPETKTITTYTRNVGYQTVMTIVERVEYKPDPEFPENRTVARRQAWVDSGMYGFRRAIEGFGVKRFEKNCAKAVDGYSWVLGKLYGGDPEKNGPGMHRETVGQKIRDLAKRKGSMGHSVYAASTTASEQSNRES